MTILYSFYGKKPFLILNDNKDKKINYLSKYCTSGPKFRGGGHLPALPDASSGPVTGSYAPVLMNFRKLLIKRALAGL